MAWGKCERGDQALFVSVEVLGEEQGCPVERVVGLVEGAYECLEHMRHPAG